MATPKKIKIEGITELEGAEIVCVCAFCNTSNRDNATLEFNFKDRKIYYFCGTCKKMNDFDLSKDFMPPMPKTRLVK